MTDARIELSSLANLHAVPEGQFGDRERRVGRRDVFQRTAAPISFLVLGLSAGGRRNDRGQCSQRVAKMFAFDESSAECKPISTAPFDRDVELAVIDNEGVHALSFRCRLTADGWINAETKQPLSFIRATHWREWPSGPKASS